MARKTKKKELSIDSLAAITRREFEQVRKETAAGFKLTVTKEELRELRRFTEKGFELMAKNFSALIQSLESFKRDVIVAVSAVHDQETEELKRRVARIEEKIGFRN